MLSHHKRIELVALALAVGALAAGGPNRASGATVPVPPDKTITSCRQIGSAEQCQCYWDRATKGMDDNQKFVLQNYVRIQVKYLKQELDALHAQKRAHPTWGGSDYVSAGFAIHLSLAPKKQAALDNLASLVSDRLYQAAVNADDDAWSYCKVGQE
jgi:hypothetical protein